MRNAVNIKQMLEFVASILNPKMFEKPLYICKSWKMIY